MSAQTVDPRVDLILRMQGDDHMVSACGTGKSSQGEHWRCRCGEIYLGEGAIWEGRQHVAREILAALDAEAPS